MKGKYIRLKTKEPSKKDEQKKLKVFNYGFAILKSLLAFLVVSVHNFKSESTNNKIVLFITKNRRYHVPSFFILSFYFMHNNLLSLKQKIILNRLMRLLIPYVGWPIIIWIINHYWNKKYNSTFAVSYEELKLQLLWGYKFIGKFLRLITSYTGPVYYLHTSLRDYLSYYNNDIKNGTFRGLIITYFIIYVFSFFGTLIFAKTPLKYLFC